MNLLFEVIGIEILFAVWWIIEEILYKRKNVKNSSSADPIEVAVERINRKKKRRFNIGMQLIPIITWIIVELLY